MCQALNQAQIIIEIWIETITEGNTNMLYFIDEEREMEWLSNLATQLSGGDERWTQAGLLQNTTLPDSAFFI